MVPATDTLPVNSASPSTYNLYSDLAVVPTPTFFVVWIPTESTCQVPPAPTLPPRLSLAIPTHCDPL